MELAGEGDFAADRAGRAARTRLARRAVVSPRFDEALQSLHSPDPSQRPDRRGAFGVCPELNCIRYRLTPRQAWLAERRAQAIGTGADRALICAGEIGEDDYAAALADSLGVPFELLEDVSRYACPLSDAQLIEAAAAGHLPLVVRGKLEFVIAPRHLAARTLVRNAEPGSDLHARIRITSSARLQRFVADHAADAIARRAADALKVIRPRLSAFSRTPRLPLPIKLVAAPLGIGVALSPAVAFASVNGVLAAIFLAWIALRAVAAIASRAPSHGPQSDMSDDRLPVYTIIVALYDEAAAVDGLIESLRALDYPPERLDIKLVLEADDPTTREALSRRALLPPFEVVVAPARGPRTKPKALNAALPFARGSFIAVYDAEDRPEPDQLRIALRAFLDGGPDLACVQARLAIDNTADSWLSGLFTAEYAGLFDVFLPGLATRRSPIPLGGSSNHFRAAILRKVGGWDPYNVTEDADLGMRLARFGYRTAVIDSTTYEEAPATLVAWLKQRTRWFKGWMQTWLVHMRDPALLWRELGPAGFCVFQLVVGGTVLAALVHPLFVVALATALLIDPIGSLAHSGPFELILLAINASTFFAGYAISIALGYAGLRRRKLARSAWVLLIVPVHWLLLSLAAWRALRQLVRDPYRWEKTRHGLARTSRRAAARPAASVTNSA